MAQFEMHPPVNMYFLLLSDFSLLSLSSALETLRIANRLGETETFNWTICSENGESVGSSLGIEFPVGSSLPDLGPRDVIFVCSGSNVREATTIPVVNWLRRMGRRGVAIGGLCTGAYVLARAGVLDKEHVTIHWENQDSLAEIFPDIELTDTTYVAENKRFTTSGGTSSIDLMLELIKRYGDEALANLVAEQLMYTNIRVLQCNARISAPDRLTVRHPKLLKVIRQMELAIETPLTIPELAAHVYISSRQLARLFKRYLSETPSKYYLKLRLLRARALLTQTDMSIINVGLACGFSTPSTFSKAYFRYFAMSPYKERI